MRLTRFWPEVWDCKFAVEVRSEVIHDSDWEEDVHAKLMGV